MHKLLLIFLAFIALSTSVHAQIGTLSQSTGNRTNKSQNQRNQPYKPESQDELNNPDSAMNNQPQGIVFDDQTLPDSVLRSHVFSFERMLRDVKIRKLKHPSLLPTGLHCNDPLASVDLPLFASLGALGQAHKPLSFNPQLSNNNFFPDPFPYFRQQLNTFKYFQTQTPYTLLGYGSSIDKDYQIHIIHTQNIRPRWNVAMLYDLVSRDGLYTNSGLTSHYLDLSTNYYSQDAKYQLLATIKYNSIIQKENGGVTNDTSCWDYRRESGVPVQMYTAQNRWRDLELHVHQSYNTVRQFDRVNEYEITVIDSTATDSASKTKTEILYDTIRAPKPFTFNTGVLALDLSYERHRRLFYDNQATSWFYNYSTNQQFIDSTNNQFYDSTIHHQLAAELYWTNDAYMQHRWKNPVVITGGIRPQIDIVEFANPAKKVKELNVSPFASARIHLGKFLLIANAEETNGERRLGDYRLNGTLSLNLGKSQLSVSALSEAQSPDLIYYHNEGIYSWDINSYNKVKQQRIAAEYGYRRTEYDADLMPKATDSIVHEPQHSKFQLNEFNFKFASTLLSDNIWFDSQMRPTQGDATALLLQADIFGHLQLGWFNLRTHQMLQHSSDNNVVRVPLFASKNSIYADFNLFHNALRAQIGVDLRYHTKFLCDAWNPVLGAFYRQNDVEVGNYLIADVWLTLQVKRATIYLRAGHVNAPIEKLAGMQPNYFSLPHYPYEGFSLYWGLIWRFFD